MGGRLGNHSSSTNAQKFHWAIVPDGNGNMYLQSQRGKEYLKMDFKRGLRLVSAKAKGTLWGISSTQGKPICHSGDRRLSQNDDGLRMFEEAQSFRSRGDYPAWQTMILV